MTEPYDWPDPTPPARAPRVLVYVALFAIGFAGVLGVLFLRAPRPIDVVAPPGYVRLSDAESGSGDMSASRAARHLGIASVPAYEDAVLRAYGRPPGEPPRAVLVLAVRSGDAPRLLDTAVAAMAARGGQRFATPAGFTGYLDVPDDRGRYVQRVLFRRGDVVYAVAVLTPARDTDTAEVVRLAERQAMGS